MNILIVDDEYYIVQGIVKIISESFTEFDCIYQAYSTEQTKRIIEKESIDILITDIEMPKETGLSLFFWIYSNLSDPDLNRSSIAEYLHMSPDYLSYVFHQKFNLTLSAYITSMRIDMAKELLERTNWGMDIIAENTFVPCAGTTTVNASFPLCKTSPLHSSVNS